MAEFLFYSLDAAYANLDEASYTGKEVKEDARGRDRLKRVLNSVLDLMRQKVTRAPKSQAKEMGDAADALEYGFLGVIPVSTLATLSQINQ